MTLDPARIREMAASYTAAWCAHEPEAVAQHYAEEGYIIINRGEPWKGREGLAAMAAGFCADFPDLVLTCDLLRSSGNHALYAWTLAGRHAGTGNQVKATGWEEWELDENCQVKASHGWFDAEDYARQVGVPA